MTSTMLSCRRKLEVELQSVLEEESRLDEEVRLLLKARSLPENGGLYPYAPAAVTGVGDGEEVEDSVNNSQGGLEQCLAQLHVSVPDFPLLEGQAGSLLAQIKDGHSMAERVSGAVRRLDDIQMRVQRALAIVEDVINLRGCAQGVREAVADGDLRRGVGFVQQFEQIEAGALADSDEMVEMASARETLSNAVLERFENAVLEMDEHSVSLSCPLLSPLRLAARCKELYLGFARRVLDGELAASVDGAGLATQNLPGIFNVSAAFLRR
ncbi:unnamed protein product, partial [Discosporangium mesarthrocarpum]